MSNPQDIPARVNCTLSVTTSSENGFGGRLYITSILKSGNITIDGVSYTGLSAIELFSPIECGKFTCSSIGQVSYYGGPTTVSCGSPTTTTTTTTTTAAPAPTTTTTAAPTTTTTTAAPTTTTTTAAPTTTTTTTTTPAPTTTTTTTTTAAPTTTTTPAPP